VVARFTVTKELEVNLLVADILKRGKSLKGSVWMVSTRAFSKQWAARMRRRLTKTKSPHIACFATKNLRAVHRRYSKDIWQFLESKAESELTQLLRRRQTALVRELRSAKALHPKLLDTDAGVKDGRQAGASALHP